MLAFQQLGHEALRVGLLHPQGQVRALQCLALPGSASLRCGSAVTCDGSTFDVTALRAIGQGAAPLS